MEDGLHALHTAEVDALLDALSDAQPSVIGAAAAAAAEPEAAAALEGSYVVYLRARPEVLQARVVAASAHDDHRPDLDLTRLDATRDPIYRARASLIVDAEEPPDAVADAISGALG